MKNTKLYIQNSEKEISLKQELGRKLFHLAASIIPIAYIVLNRFEMIVFVATSLILSLAIDMSRLHFQKLQLLFQTVFGQWLRPKEFLHITGASYFLIGSLITILIIPEKQIVIPALLFLSLGDVVAALVGKQWGQIRVFRKTLEGSIACLIVCFTVSLYFVDLKTGIIGAATASAVELLPIPINDNVLIPVISGSVMFFLML